MDTQFHTAEDHPVKFTGTAGEYFGIWIVNVLLSILTLGVYSAWAKVRYKKYFYGNTFIDNHNFDYHATGQQILIGRIIVIVALTVLAAVSVVSTALYVILYLILIGCLGLIISRALRFNARVSSYRNVRFDFAGDAGEAFLVFVIFPFLNFFALGLTTPLVTRAANRYVIRNHKYGDRSFYFDADIGEYYKWFMIMLAVAIVGMIMIMIPMMGAAFASMMGDFENATEEESIMAIYSIMAVFYLGFFLVIIPASMIYRVAVRNIMYNNSILDDRHTFVSTLKILPFIWIVISNAILALVTFGLMIPWGRIRLARYLAENTRVIAGGPLDVYSSDVIDTHGVTASEYIDLEGFDIDVGI